MNAAAYDIVAEAGVEAAYLRLLQDHGGAIRRMAGCYERDPSRREDLVQDICMALWQALPRFRDECSERTFVYRVAHNRAVTYVLRARRTTAAPLDDASTVTDSRDDPERSAQARERREQLREGVRALPLGLRQVIVLSLEGLSARDVAAVLGITENNVAVRLTRARQALRRLLDRGQEG